MNKTMKNIKMVPTYAGKLGNGIFAGAKWMCVKCGKQVSGSSMPHPQYGNKCPDTSSGNHVWQQC